jgi:2-polyprenyl-6-methoxyphenol hydroxylase-like FAD-dependent oxidoreductase
MNTDVLLVGAGPTGLGLACQLIRYGVGLTIIDNKEMTTPYSKAIDNLVRQILDFFSSKKCFIEMWHVPHIRRYEWL